MNKGRIWDISRPYKHFHHASLLQGRHICRPISINCLPERVPLSLSFRVSERGERIEESVGKAAVRSTLSAGLS